MKNKFFGLLLILGTLGFVYLPGEARAADNRSESVVANTEAKAFRDVRYVRVRGKRYKVWYKTYYKRGKRYVRITRVVRA